MGLRVAWPATVGARGRPAYAEVVAETNPPPARPDPGLASPRDRPEKETSALRGGGGQLRRGERIRAGVGAVPAVWED